MLIVSSLIVIFSGCEGESASDQEEATESVSSQAWIGSAACMNCHPNEGAAWRGSHHDRAMESPGRETVHAPFDGEEFEEAGQVWQFVREADEYWVELRASEAGPERLRVLYTFGAWPLQQYLVEREGGRFQALPVAWDTRPKAGGGARWFSLGEDLASPPPQGDPLHWEALAYNWNSQCASCHSTRLVKAFEDSTNTFETAFAEIDVACEACHGPGARHQANPEGPDGFLEVAFESFSPDRWSRPEGQRIASRREPLARDAELDACGGCHARRAALSDGASPGTPILDAHRPSLVEADLYFEDGQIREEVYVWGSFLQSRMHAAGVRCSDCHDPHSLELRRSGNALCSGCHAPAVFDVAAHHGHLPGSDGSACVDCHMPERTYMKVDERGDHSFPVPRPRIAEALGAPNVCASCHAGEGAEWAAQAIEGGEVGGREPAAARAPHWTETLVEEGAPRSDSKRWLEIATDPRAPELIRASAWARYGQEAVGAPPLDFLKARLRSAGSLERLGFIETARRLAPAPRVALLVPLLEDRAKAVRIAAAEALLDISASELPGAARSALARGLSEYREAQEANAERPEAQVNLASLAVAYGEHEQARVAYGRAIKRAPYFVPAYVNLADLERAQGRDAASVARLREAVGLAPDQTEVRYALGLALHRTGETEEALTELERASLEAPEDARLRLAYALSLEGAGRRTDALSNLEEGVRSGWANADLYHTWASLLREAGDLSGARAAVAEWQNAFPSDLRPGAFLQDLELRSLP